VITCRYVDRNGNRCTGEATDPEAELLLCIRHMACALELVRHLAAKHPSIAITFSGSAS
jgi:hypothetical protein